VAEGDPDDAGRDDTLLTLQEAADRLKVHYMTAYRWVRRGDLPAFKTGGRLRVRARDLEAFLQERQVDVAAPTDGGGTDWDTHVDALHRLLLAGERSEAGALVRKVITDGAPVGDVYVRLLTPVMHRIGDDWVDGRISVAEEHRATEIVSSLVARLGDHFRRRGPSRGTAVTLTPAGDHHVLASTMVADFLRAAGWDVHHLGANVPADDLHTFLQIVPAELVCLSVTRPDLERAVLERLREVVVETTGHSPLLGGQGVSRELADELGARYLASLEELASGSELVSGAG